jgi:hypothetical protein
MSDQQLKPLDADLALLLKSETRATPAPDAARARVLARVESTLLAGGGGGGAHGGGAPTARQVGWSFARPLSLVSALLVGGAGGALLTRALERPPTPVIVYVSRPSSPGPSAPASLPASEGRMELPASVPAPGISARAAASAPEPHAGQLAQERALLDVARTALGRGEGEETLTALGKHEKRYPNGQLAEEREAIGIQALLLLARYDEARARGGRFRQRYPGSVLLPAVEAALATIP